MSSTTLQSLKSHFLIAMPHMADPSFAQTLTLVCEHSTDGALGIVVNRPTNLTLGEIFKQVGIKQPALEQHHKTTVYAGGPVAVERGFVLHSGERCWEASLEITKGLHLTTTRDILISMANNTGPSEVLVVLGYAGWGAGQLEQEISDNAWLTCKAQPDIIFQTAPDQRLNAAANSLGIDLSQLTDQVGHS